MPRYSCCNDSIDLITRLATGKYFDVQDAVIKMRAIKAFLWQMLLGLIRLIRNGHMLSGSREKNIASPVDQSTACSVILFYSSRAAAEFISG